MSNLNFSKRNFLLYAFGQGMSKLGSALTYYALSLEILKTTQDMRLFALALSLKFIPQIILYPVAGALVDSIDRKKLMITIDLLRCTFLALSAAIIVNAPSHKGTMIFLIIIILSLFEVLYNPAANALIPSIFKSTELVTINTTLSWINSASTMISPLLGSIIYMKFGISRAIAIDAITYLIVGFLFLNLVTHDVVSSSHSSTGWLSEIKVGFRLISNNKDLRLSTIAIGVSRLFVNSFYSIGVPVIIIQVFKGTEIMLGSVQTMLMCGALISPIIVLVLKKEPNVLNSLLLSRAGKLVPFSLLLILVLPEIQNIFKDNPMYLVVFLGGICFLGTLFNSAGFVFLNTYFQRRVQKDQLGRFSGIRFMIYSITEPLGMNIFGFLYNQQSITVPVVLVFIGVLLEIVLINIVKKESGHMDRNSVCIEVN